MKLLVTGASGLLGANFTLAALERGHRLIASSRRGIKHPGLESRRDDLTRLGACEELLAQARPDWVVHCAAMPAPVASATRMEAPIATALMTGSTGSFTG